MGKASCKVRVKAGPGGCVRAEYERGELGSFMPGAEPNFEPGCRRVELAQVGLTLTPEPSTTRILPDSNLI